MAASAPNNNGTDADDYLDELARLLPSHRSFTSLERLLIVVIVSGFVSLVGCTLLCLIYPHSPLRRRLGNRKKVDAANNISRKSILVIPPPPSYESLVKADNLADLNKLSTSKYFNGARKSSNGTMSDSDGMLTNSKNDYLLSLNGKLLRSQSARSSLSTVGSLSTISNTYPLVPYAQVNVEIEIDTTDNVINLHLTNGEHVSVHPAFDEQGDYFIRMQLLNMKVWKKCQDAWKRRRSSLPLNIWKKQPEKMTKHLSHTTNDTLICDERVQFPFNKNDLALISIRFLLCCTDRSGIQDVMLEASIPLSLSMVPHHQQVIEFKDLPQITFAEIFLGLSYLPTAERLTIHINKLRYFCKIEKEKTLDARVTVTFFHHGRRFLQKKIPCVLDGSSPQGHEINDTITQNIPVQDLQSVYIHLELNGKDDQAIIPCTSILLGRHTYHEAEWQKLLEQPRQMHLGWYPFLG